MKTKLPWLLIALCLLLTACTPETPQAPEMPEAPPPAIVAQGSCGATTSWTLDETGTLTVTGTGSTEDYTLGVSSQPWNSCRDQIKTLVVEGTVTRIGERAFQKCTALESVTVQAGVQTVGKCAFLNCSALTRVELPEGIFQEDGAFRNTPAEWEMGVPPSADYAASKYYKALQNVVLTGNYRDDVIAVALSQLGYHEGDSEADYGGGNSAGNGDYAEYGRVIGTVGRAWCSEFASWCLRHARVPQDIIASSQTACVSTFTGGTTAAYYTWDQTVYGGGSYTPRQGDILLWAWNMSEHHTNENLSHTCILREVVVNPDGTLDFLTIDGNSGDRVRERDYLLDPNGTCLERTGRLYYIISPDYESAMK